MAGIQAYLQLEGDGNWYAYRSGVAKAAIFKYTTNNHTSRRLKFDELRPNSRLLRSQSIYLDFDCERSRSRTGSGQRQTDSFPIANVFWEGDCFWTRGISYRNDQVAGNGPRGSKTARRAAVFDSWGPLSGGSVIGVTGLPSTGSQ